MVGYPGDTTTKTTLEYPIAHTNLHLRTQVKGFREVDRLLESP